MFYSNLKKIIKRLPFLWNFLIWLKNRFIILSRLKDVLMMMILFHLWPTQAYRFSTRKYLPSKKNRFSKKLKPTIPYELMLNKSKGISKMKEITVIGRGSSFDLNDIKKINGPIFLLSFWSPLKIDNNGKILYNSDYSYETGVATELEKYLLEQSKTKDFTKKNITYVIGRKKVLEMLKKRNHKVLCVVPHYEDKNGNVITCSNYFHELLSSYPKLFENRISVLEKIYKPTPSNQAAPTGSVFPIICALSYFAEKVNVYGWDFYLDSSPEKMSYWKLFLNMYKYKPDVTRSKNHFESALINFYYGYQLSKLPNININSYLGQLNKHEKLIRRIEKVLFQ